MLKDNKEKVCLFFASDYHFEMISLPYINKKLKEDKNVIVITENDLNGSINKLLSNINLKVEDKDKISKIDWNNNNLNKINEIKNAKEIGKETVVFVKGRANYINNINDAIKDFIDIDETSIIDCYDINEVEKDISNIAKNYDRVLSTSGIEKLL